MEKRRVFWNTECPLFYRKKANFYFIDNIYPSNKTVGMVAMLFPISVNSFMRELQKTLTTLGEMIKIWKPYIDNKLIYLFYIRTTKTFY